MRMKNRIKRSIIYLCVAVLVMGNLITVNPAMTQGASKKAETVDLNYNSYVLKSNQTVKLKATCIPKGAKNKKVKWKSSNPSVATVSSTGKVTAKKKGTTKITAVAKDGSGKKAVCIVKVVKKLTKIKKLQLAASDTEVKPGSTLALSATVKPAKATLKKLKWESSNTQVATVSQKGVVTTVGEGIVKITAKAQDGSKKKASYTLSVKMPPAEQTKDPETAANHTQRDYIYKLDRNAKQYQKVYTEPGKESTSVTEASTLSASVFMWSFYLHMKGGITTEQKFCEFLDYFCKANTLAIFGVQQLSVKECAKDYSSVTLEVKSGTNKNTMTFDNIEVLEIDKAVTDPDGLQTKASRIGLKLGAEKLIMEIYNNGSRIAIYRPNYSVAHFEFYQDNTNYKYVMRMTKFFNGVLMDELNTFPNFKYLELYNIY